MVAAEGELEEGEDPLAGAVRELKEETGFEVDGHFRPLRPLRQPSGKTILTWAVEGDCDPAGLRSGLFSMEWPQRSGMRQEFPEVDRGDWFTLTEARRRIVAGQAPFLDELMGWSDAPILKRLAPLRFAHRFR